MKTIKAYIGGMKGKCPCCLEQVYFKYDGKQEDGQGGKFDLYDCQSCKTTLSLRTILNFNSVEVKNESRRMS